MFIEIKVYRGDSASSELYERATADNFSDAEEKLGRCERHWAKAELEPLGGDEDEVDDRPNPEPPTEEEIEDMFKGQTPSEAFRFAN